MNDTFERYTKKVRERAEMGLNIIAALKKSVEQEKKEDYTAVYGPSNRSLEVCYYGYRMRFHVEIELKNEPNNKEIPMDATAKIAAYELPYETESQEVLITVSKEKAAPLAETPIPGLEYDKDCKIDFSKWPGGSVDQFASDFLIAVFKAALKKGMVLRSILTPARN